MIRTCNNYAQLFSNREKFSYFSVKSKLQLRSLSRINLSQRFINHNGKETQKKIKKGRNERREIKYHPSKLTERAERDFTIARS